MQTLAIARMTTLRLLCLSMTLTVAGIASGADRADWPAAPHAIPGDTPDGAIIAREPCAVVADAAQFSAAVEAYYLADLLKAKLGDALKTTPLSRIFTAAENRRLVGAVKRGRCERLRYRSDGLSVVGFLLHPAKAGPHPVLIWLRGGNREFAKIEQVTMLNLLHFADAGFIVIAPQYRGVDGGDGVDEFGGADVNDVLALLPLARALPDADVERLYLLGGSRGAMQGALAMRSGLPVRAAAFRGGMFDMKAALVARPELEPMWKALMPDYAIDADSALSKRSAVLWAGELQAPILLLHGRDDWRVPVAQAEAFAAELDKAGTRHKLVVYKHDEHQLALHRAQWLAEVVDWFRTHGAFKTMASTRHD